MQDFHPDCTINLVAIPLGKPAKYAWACSLVTRESVRLVLARRFAGLVPREEAEWEAILFGLRQARRLMQEKVRLCAGYDLFPGGDATGGRKDPRLQSKKDEAEKIWASFRLRREERLDPTEEQALRAEAAKVFSRKAKG